MARKAEREALREALAKVNALLAAAQGEESTCTVFRDDESREDVWQDWQVAAVRRYVTTWIHAPLVAAVRGIEGSRDFDNERALDDISSGRARYRF
jgi:hypothetical protein